MSALKEWPVCSCGEVWPCRARREQGETSLHRLRERRTTLREQYRLYACNSTVLIPLRRHEMDIDAMQSVGFILLSALGEDISSWSVTPVVPSMATGGYYLVRSRLSAQEAATALRKEHWIVDVVTAEREPTTPHTTCAASAICQCSLHALWREAV